MSERILGRFAVLLCGLVILPLVFIGARSPVRAGEIFPLAGEAEVHRLRFFLGPALVGDLTMEELGWRLSQYADDLNVVFGKQTIRRFLFDPGTDITITPSPPHTGTFVGILPETGYEIWIYAVLTDVPSYGTYGGYMSVDQSGAGVATDLKWDRIHDPLLLTDGSDDLEQYWRQIDHITHELEHVFGAGIGEYYYLCMVDDLTGFDPVLDIRKDAIDPYWSRRQDYFADPLLNNIWNLSLVGNPTSRNDLFDTINLAEVTVEVVNRGPRNNDTKMATLPDLSAATVEVSDAETGTPLSDASVTVWKVRSFPPYYNEITAEGLTDYSGGFVFTWTPYPHISVFSNYDHLKLIKVYAQGYEPAAEWVSIYDCQEAKLVYGMDRMIVPVQLFPEPPFCPGDVDGDGNVGGSDLGILAESFGSSSGDSRYNPDVDFEPDGDVDGSNAAFLANDFGRVDCP